MPPPKTDKDRERAREKRKAREGADGDKAKTHKLSLKGSARLVAEFVGFSGPLCGGVALLTVDSSNTRYIPSCGFGRVRRWAFGVEANEE